MTRYIEWGDREPKGDHCLHLMGGRRPVDPTDLATVQALWSTLPSDLRLALAKTAPKMAGPWEPWGRLWRRRCPSTLNDLVSGEEHQLPELDRLLLADGYVLDGDTP